MRGLTRKEWSTDVDYNPPRCFYDGMDGPLQSRFSPGKQVRVAEGVAYINPSNNAEEH
jgi:hypothetical protein